MNFAEALILLHEGKKVGRRFWKDDMALRYVYLNSRKELTWANGQPSCLLKTFAVENSIDWEEWKEPAPIRLSDLKPGNRFIRADSNNNKVMTLLKAHGGLDVRPCKYIYIDEDYELFGDVLNSIVRPVK